MSFHVTRADGIQVGDRLADSAVTALDGWYDDTLVPTTAATQVVTSVSYRPIGSGRVFLTFSDGRTFRTLPDVRVTVTR